MVDRSNYTTTNRSAGSPQRVIGFFEQAKQGKADVEPHHNIVINYMWFTLIQLLILVVPKAHILFYQDASGEAPVLNWLKDLLKRDRKGYANCVARMQQLADAGHELRRPASDYLQDGIYELRAKHVHVQYRILYFFHGQNVAILAHAIMKDTSQVPASEIERAIKRKRLFEENPAIHTYAEEIEDGENQ